jgi:hypothetical protein
VYLLSILVAWEEGERYNCARRPWDIKDPRSTHLGKGSNNRNRIVEWGRSFLPAKPRDASVRDCLLWTNGRRSEIGTCRRFRGQRQSFSERDSVRG